MWGGWLGPGPFRLRFKRAATKRWPVGRGRVGGFPVRFRLGCRRFGVEHERFLVLWVMRVFLGWGIIVVRTGIWIPYRSRVGVSRLSQASGLFAPLAGSETTRPALGSGGLSPGLAWYAPRAIGTRSQAEKARRTDSEPWSGRSPGRDHPNRRQCPERGTHTQPTHTQEGHTGNAHPLTAVSRLQSASAVGKWQHAARSTQHRKEVTPHMHTPATTHPQHGHAQWKTAPAPTLGEPTRPAHPAPASPADPAPAPAPARPWTPDGPARRTNSTPAPAPATHPDPRHTRSSRCQPEPRPTRRPTRQHHRESTPPHRRCRLHLDPNQPGPGREPPANCSLFVADRLQLNRRPARPRPATSANHSRLRRCRLQPDPNQPGPSQRPRPTSRLFVAAACSPTQTSLVPASDLGQSLASSSLPPAARPKTSPAPASDPGQPLASSSLTGCSPTATVPRPGDTPCPRHYHFVAAGLKLKCHGAPTRQGHGNTTPLDARAGLGRGPS